MPRTPQPALLDAAFGDGGPDSDATTERILDAALEEFLDFGLRRATVEDITRRAGVGRMTVHRRFSTKQSLIEAVWLREVLGVGAGLTFPTLSGVAVGAMPGTRFAMATALNSVARQIGAALGVAALIAILGNPSPAQALTAYLQSVDTPPRSKPQPGKSQPPATKSAASATTTAATTTGLSVPRPPGLVPGR